MLHYWAMQTSVQAEDTPLLNFPIADNSSTSQRFWDIESACEGSGTADFHDAWLLTG